MYERGNATPHARKPISELRFAFITNLKLPGKIFEVIDF